MKIAIASEHAGFTLKEEVKEHLYKAGLEMDDLGANSADVVDYPEIAVNLAEKVAKGEYSFGILLCGTGIGMCIVAGKVPGVRPALCTNEFMAEMTRKHNDANVLCLGAWVTGSKLSCRIADAFVKHDFEGGRHERRVKSITDIEIKYKMK